MLKDKRSRERRHLVRETVNSAGYPELEEPIRLREKHYSLFWYMQL